jgi:hypothetical protein
MDQTSMDQTEKEKSELAKKSGRQSELKADKDRETRRWQRKRATIRRFAGMK